MNKIMVFNLIEHDMSFDVNKAGLSPSDIFSITNDLTNLKTKEKDVKLAAALDATVISDSRREEPGFYIRTFDYTKLGKLANEFLYMQIKQAVLLFNQNQYVYSVSDILEYLSTIDDKKSKEIKNILKKKNIKGSGFNKK